MNNFNLFGIGPMELIFVLIIALVVMGPERLPQVAREIAKLITQVREIYTEIMGTLTKEFGDMEELKEIQRDLNSLRDPLNLNKMLTKPPTSTAQKPSTVAPQVAKPLAAAAGTDKPAAQTDVIPSVPASPASADENQIGAPQPQNPTENAGEIIDLGANSSEAER
jgi:sec-independent protein translocase protein TatB